MNNNPVAKCLINALDDENHDVQNAAATALGKLKEPRAVEPLINRLVSGIGPTEVFGVALANIGPSAVVPLIEVLTEVRKVNFPDRRPHSNPRKVAADALGIIKDQRAIEPLITASKDNDLSTRKSSIKAIGEIASSIK